MPITKSAIQEARLAEKRRARNKPVRTQSKTRITKAEKLIFSGELEAAQKEVVAAVSTLDKAVKKGILHANNAARRKSRLMKKLNAAKTPTPA
ncbi:MAG: 30S ribosomal protein S20 [Dehalococcoidia bacterium]|nr:30S ribosomal protein S20 [Dehalococcoidia bacterium]